MSDDGRQVVGKVSIKVVPDTRDFRKRTKRELKEKIQGLEIKVPVISEVDRSALDRAERQLKDRLGEIESKVKPDISAAARRVAKAQLEELSRSRRSRIDPIVNSVAAKKAAATLAALSGARVGQRLGRELGDFLANLDRNAPKYAAIGLGITNLGAAALSASANLFALSQSLAQIGATSLALPGIVAGITIALGATIAVLKDFGQVIPEAKGLLSDLQDQMSARFWAKAEAPARRFIDTVFPQFADGLINTSDALGTFFANLTDDFSRSLEGQLAPMFRNLNDSILIAAGSTDAYTGIIRTLGLTGSEYLPRLAEFFTDIAERFDRFLETARNDGRLAGWIDQGIVQLNLLGSALGSIGGILAAVARAAERAGGTTLRSFADVLDRIERTVNTTGFQDGLTRTFIAADTAMREISNRSGKQLTRFLEELSLTLGTVLPLAGEATGTALGAVFDGLARQSVQRGILKAFLGIRDAIDNFAPVIPEVADALGALLSVIGTLVSNTSGPLASAMGFVAEAIQRIAPSVEAASGPLAELLDSFIQLAGPTLLTVADGLGVVIDFAGMLASAINSLPGPIKDLIAVAAIAAVGFSVAGPFGAVAGAATAMFTLGEKAAGAGPKLDKITEAQNRARTAADQLGEAVRQAGGKIDENVRKLAIQNILKDNLDGVARTIGVSLATVADATVGNAKAIERVKTAANDYLEFLDRMPGADQTARDGIRQLLTQIDASGKSIKDARRDAELLKEALAGSGQGEKFDGKAQTEALARMNEQARHFNESLGSMITGFGDLGEQTAFPTVGLNDEPFNIGQQFVGTVLKALGLSITDPRVGLDDSVLRSKNTQILGLLGVLGNQKPTPKADLDDNPARTKVNRLTAFIPEAINAIAGAAQRAGTNVGSAAASGAQSVSFSGFNQAGSEAGAGYSQGLSGWIQTVAGMGESLARAAIEGARRAQQSRSPSKVTRALGGDFGSGYTLGIEAQIGNVASAARRMADAAVAPISAQTVQYRAQMRSGDLAALRSAVSLETTAPVIKQFNYHAAENRSLSAEEELFRASDKARMFF